MIPLVITAKNEQKAIQQCLESIINSVKHVEHIRNISFDIIVVLDDCTDQTGMIATSFKRVKILQSSGGIVEAQRKAVESTNADFIIFSDADIYVEQEALLSITDAMHDNGKLLIAYPIKHPLRPKRNTLIAKALYTYNKFNGFQTKRHYFNGRFFAVRHWFIPTTCELKSRIKQLPACKFYCYQEGIRTDDIYLSRYALSQQGRKSIQQTTSGVIYYRPAETYLGMYFTYRRMRMEIERLDQLLPHTVAVHARHGIRKYDSQSIHSAKYLELFYWTVFRFTLQICKIHYFSEKIWYQYFADRNCPAWKTIQESKTAIYFE